MVPAPGRRRRRELDDGESDVEATQGEISQVHDLKRQRRSSLNRPSSMQNGISSTPDDTAVELVDISTYQPGSILRISVKNFVTYTSAEFILGPSLNMIIGPNGTGKSTLVCAICLGLGWGPKNLGRAKELGEFVKHGAQQAQIEIELKGGPEQRGRNVVIRRVIKKEGNKSSWYLNNEVSNNAKVLALAKSFSIQIDNLCQFLPQDRVVEFAQMHPVEMLSSTQRAAASPEMVEMHEKLKSLKADEMQEQVFYKDNKEKLNVLQTRQNQQRADVERMEERANLKKKIELYEKFKPLIRYKDIRIKDREAKEKLQECRAELHELEQRVEPSLQSLRKWEAHSHNVSELKEERRKIFGQAERRVFAFNTKIAQVAKQLENNENLRKFQYEAEKHRKAELVKIRDKIQRLEKEKEETRVEYDPEAFQTKLQEARERKRSAENDLREIDNEVGELLSRARPMRSRIDALKDDLNNLKSKSGQRLQKLRQLSRDTARAYEWLQSNKDRFEGEVYGPPLMVCSVKNPGHADIVESCLQKSDFTMFTCTSNADLKTFQEAVYGTELSLSDVTVRSVTRSLDAFRSKITSEQLQRHYGLEGWIVDLLDGPEPVLAALCDSSRINRTGYTLGDLTNAQFETLRHSEDVPAWATPQNINSVTRRKEYGPKAVSIQSRQVKRANCWTESVDTNAEEELKRKHAAAAAEFAQLQTEVQQKKATKAGPETAIREAQSEINTITAEKDRIQRAYGFWLTLPNKIANLEEKKRSLEESSGDILQALAEISAEREKLTLERAEVALEYAQAAKSLEKVFLEMLESEVWHIEAQSQEDTLKNVNREITAMLNEKRAEVTELEIRHREIRSEGKKLASEASNIANSLTAEERTVHRDLNEQETTLDQLEAEILSMNTRLGLLHEGNPRALEQYETRKLEIEKMADAVGASAAKLSRLQAQMEEIRDRWEPQLDALVTRISDAFSYNFSQIGCAGQVTVHKDEDYSKWEIRIFVKFREHEQLSLLDNHRQSGGERSVSTIFYLMALQSLAKSPFRVVDEINQGMDPRNERTVHERMVEIACGRGEPDAGEDDSQDGDGGAGPTNAAKEHDGQSQYFLITPKLLTGLKYHPRMKLHVINSGESLPDDLHELNLSSIVSRYAEMKGIAAA